MYIKLISSTKITRDHNNAWMLIQMENSVNFVENIEWNSQGGVQLKLTLTKTNTANL